MTTVAALYARKSTSQDGVADEAKSVQRQLDLGHAFAHLILTDQDRLGREQIETAYILKQLAQAGVRIWEAQDGGREVKLDTPAAKMVMAVLTGAAEIERDKARARTRDALRRKAERGHVTGGRVFGYQNVPVVDAAGRRDHVRREILAAEAAIVCRIFTEYAAGRGGKVIALG